LALAVICITYIATLRLALPHLVEGGLCMDSKPETTGIPGRRIKKGVGPVSGAASGIDLPSESARWAMEGWRN